MGRPDVVIGLFDGPVALDHPDLAGEYDRLLPMNRREEDTAMTMPGFTAEASLGKPSQHYHIGATAGIAAGSYLSQQVLPQIKGAGFFNWGGHLCVWVMDWDLGYSYVWGCIDA